MVSSSCNIDARVALCLDLRPGRASRELVLSLFDHFLTFGVLRVKKSEKWFTRMRTRASADSEEKWFVRPATSMLASLSVSICIPVGHHVSSFSAFSTFFDFRC